MQVLITADELGQGVDRLARQIRADYQARPLTILGVLTGSIVLLADLIRRLDMPLEIGLLQASSYRGAATEPGPLTWQEVCIPDIRGRDVLLLDDILDTGHTLSVLLAELRTRQPRSLACAVLLWKQGRQEVPVRADYVGFVIPDRFVVGYGLDYRGAFRQLPHVAALDPCDLAP